MIECVNISNCHLFDGNPIYEQHCLRYQSIIERQKWDVPRINGMEYDQFDNPAAHYIIKRNRQGRAVGVARLYPTDRPYMLSESFPHMVTKIDMPSSSNIWEGSRFCIDSSLPAHERKTVMHELVLGYLEFAVKHQAQAIIGLMFPVYWKNIFIKSGWNVEWIGDVHKSDEGHKIIAGLLPVSQNILENVRNTTGIHTNILNEGNIIDEPIRKAG